MKAKMRALIVLVLLNILLAGAIAILLTMPGKEAALQENATVYEVTDLSASQIMAVKVENENAAYAIMQNGPNIELISTLKGEWDQTQLRAFIYAAGHISGSRKVEEEAAFGNYGMADPRSSIAIFLSDGTEKYYRVLARNPLDQGSYFYSEEDNAIFLVAQDVADLFLRTEKDFLRHTVFSITTEDEFAGVDKIAVKYFGKGRDYIVEKKQQGYYLTSPSFIRLPQERVAGDLFGSILGLYADEIVAAQADLHTYGLDQPDMQMQITVNDRIQTAVFRMEDNNVCLMAQPNGTTVYRLDADPVLMLMQDYTTLLGSSIVTYAAGDLSDLTLTRGDKLIYIEFALGGASIAANAVERQLSAGEIALLMQAVNRVPPVGELSGNTAAAPAITMTANFLSGLKETVEFIPVTEDVYAVSINGAADFATSAQAVLTLYSVADSLASSEGENE